MRRVAANTAICGNERIEPAVIELVGETVVRYSPLTEELAATEWIGGEIVLQGNKDSLRAYKDGKLLSE
ncbi:hypothetical protein CTM63_09315 [Prevotella intermedia]|jgi:hypothetical protein|uniref:hypothetical protein n=1 Tax=Prevotella intermedia TaxID=28131 RepID=UPI000C1BEC96|nr:hypothetical protein [Prevotella intermedia]ATV29440.1 hypothetical protein CTM63_09315 [Prevotella intermedia]